MIFILDAHFANFLEPGTYSKHLNQTLKKNNLQPITLQDNPNSEKLFKTDVVGNALKIMKRFREETDSDEPTKTTRPKPRIKKNDPYGN